MENKRLKIVLDTNVFLVSLASEHSYSWVYDALIDERYELCVTNEILTEYDEIISSRYGVDTSLPLLEGLTFLPNIHLIIPYFRWNLLDDEDDNKFVDCAVAGNADFIVSNDRGFNKLKSIGFPPIHLLDYAEFENQYKSILLAKS